MQSSDDPEYNASIEYPDQVRQPVPSYGRTGWDVIYGVRKIILLLVIVGGMGGIYLYSAKNGIDLSGAADSVRNVISAYYPLALAAIFGYLLMSWLLSNFYRPSCRFVFCSSVEDQMAGLFRIPENRFRTMNQPGNPAVFKTPSGGLIYFAQYVDPDANEIGYGWGNIDKWELVSADRELFIRMKEDYQYLVNRVMYLEGHLDVEAAILARGPMEDLANSFRDRFRLRGRKISFRSAAVSANRHNADERGESD